MPFPQRLRSMSKKRVGPVCCVDDVGDIENEPSLEVVKKQECVSIRAFFRIDMVIKRIQ